MQHLVQERALKLAEAESKAITEAFTSYMQLNSGMSPTAASGVDAQGGAPVTLGAGGQMPAIMNFGEGFSDRVIAQGIQSRDVEYRQQLNERQISAATAVLDEQDQLDFDKWTMERIKTASGGQPVDIKRVLSAADCLTQRAELAAEIARVRDRDANGHVAHALVATLAIFMQPIANAPANIGFGLLVGALLAGVAVGNCMQLSQYWFAWPVSRRGVCPWDLHMSTYKWVWCAVAFSIWMMLVVESRWRVAAASFVLAVLATTGLMLAGTRGAVVGVIAELVLLSAYLAFAAGGWVFLAASQFDGYQMSATAFAIGLIPAAILTGLRLAPAQR